MRIIVLFFMICFTRECSLLQPYLNPHGWGSLCLEISTYISLFMQTPWSYMLVDVPIYHVQFRLLLPMCMKCLVSINVVPLYQCALQTSRYETTLYELTFCLCVFLELYLSSACLYTWFCLVIFLLAHIYTSYP